MKEPLKLAPSLPIFIRAYRFEEAKDVQYRRSLLHVGNANSHPYGEKLVGVWRIKYKILK